MLRRGPPGPGGYANKHTSLESHTERQALTTRTWDRCVYVLVDYWETKRGTSKHKRKGNNLKKKKTRHVREKTTARADFKMLNYSVCPLSCYLCLCVPFSTFICFCSLREWRRNSSGLVKCCPGVISIRMAKQPLHFIYVLALTQDAMWGWETKKYKR